MFPTGARCQFLKLSVTFYKISKFDYIHILVNYNAFPLIYCLDVRYKIESN